MILLAKTDYRFLFIIDDDRTNVVLHLFTINPWYSARGVVKLMIFDPHKQSTVSSLKLSGRELGARHRLPFTICPRTKLAIVNRSRQMPAQSEQIAYHTINRKKALGVPH